MLLAGDLAMGQSGPSVGCILSQPQPSPTTWTAAPSCRGAGGVGGTRDGNGALGPVVVGYGRDAAVGVESTVTTLDDSVHAHVFCGFF
jgi:hypothetical protein